MASMHATSQSKVADFGSCASFACTMLRGTARRRRRDPNQLYPASSCGAKAHENRNSLVAYRRSREHDGEEACKLLSFVAASCNKSAIRTGLKTRVPKWAPGKRLSTSG